MSQDSTNKIILWSSSYAEPMNEVVKYLTSRGVRVDYVNENPECPSTEICDFSKKLYFDVLLDDKAGFDPDSDWECIYEKLKDLEYAKSDDRLPKVLIPMITRHSPFER